MIRPLLEADPPGPEVVFRLTLPQAADVFEAYKGARFRRPETSEIYATMQTALEAAIGGSYYQWLREALR